MKRYAMQVAFVVGCALASLGTPASAQDKPIELELSHWGPPTHVNQKVFLPWAEMADIYRGILPFLAAMVVLLGILMIAPEIALYLPRTVK